MSFLRLLVYLTVVVLAVMLPAMLWTALTRSWQADVPVRFLWLYPFLLTLIFTFTGMVWQKYFVAHISGAKRSASLFAAIVTAGLFSTLPATFLWVLCDALYFSSLRGSFAGFSMAGRLQEAWPALWEHIARNFLVLGVLSLLVYEVIERFTSGARESTVRPFRVFAVIVLSSIPPIVVSGFLSELASESLGIGKKIGMVVIGALVLIMYGMLLYGLGRVALNVAMEIERRIGLKTEPVPLVG